jgi:asparagine synthase (glutamine-hydrolysing)
VSALAGCIRLDGAPANPRTLVSLLAAAAHRAPGRHATWASGPAALAHGRSRHDTSPAQPCRDALADTTIVFDGRLDNRGELIAALSCAPDLGDASLALAAYARWGTRAAASLDGDFAFAIWDAPGRRLFCARDVMGQRPLFYARTGNCLVVASEPQQVLAHPSVSRQIDEGIVAEQLSGMQATIPDTLWRDVKRLPPACALVADDDGVRVMRYWDFDPAARLDLPDPEAHADRLRGLLTGAVARRVRDVRTTVGLFLSGGLDSSTLAGLAVQQHRSGGPGVHALSLVYPGRACDESAEIAAVVSRWQLPAEQLEPAPAWRDLIEAEVDRYRSTPAWPNGVVLQPLRTRARQLGLDVVLTGYGGDEWFSGSVHHTADLLRAGRLVAAARQLRQDVALPRHGFSYAALIRIAVAPLLPGWLKAVVKPVLGSPRPRYDWIRPELAARAELAARLAPPPVPGFPTLAQRDIYRVARGSAQVIGDELDERAAAADGLELRHPFYDRSVAEFGLALPESERWEGGETKRVLRRAFRDIIPPGILARKDKAEFSSTYVDALRGLGGGSFFETLRIEGAGWVDGAVIRRRCDDMFRLYSRGDEAYIECLDALWSVASIEIWARRML